MAYDVWGNNDAGRVKEIITAIRVEFGVKQAVKPERQVMPKVDGKSFRCECGGNVFSEIGSLHYRCNSCGSTFTGEK